MQRTSGKKSIYVRHIIIGISLVYCAYPVSRLLRTCRRAAVFRASLYLYYIIIWTLCRNEIRADLDRRAWCDLQVTRKSIPHIMFTVVTHVVAKRVWLPINIITTIHGPTSTTPRATVIFDGKCACAYLRFITIFVYMMMMMMIIVGVQA